MFTSAKKISAACIALIVGAEAASAGESSPALEKIKNAGAIVIGYHDPAIPMSYTDAEQQPIGFSMDLCGLVANKIKQTSGLADLKINYQPLAPGDGASPVQNGTADIVCGATAVTPELQQQAGFSVPIFASELRWIVPRKLRVERELRHRRRRTEMITPSSAGDLKGKTVALTGGSPATTSLVLTLSVDRSLGLSILEGKDDAESFKLVESGRASAFLADDVLLVGLKANAKNPDAFGFLDDAYPGRSYALMFRKDDKPFKELVDGVLTEAMASGEYAALYSKWFESPIPPRNVNLDYPMPAALKALIKAPGEKPGSSEGEKGQANLSLNR